MSTNNIFGHASPFSLHPREAASSSQTLESLIVNESHIDLGKEGMNSDEMENCSKINEK